MAKIEDTSPEETAPEETAPEATEETVTEAAPEAPAAEEAAAEAPAAEEPAAEAAPEAPAAEEAAPEAPVAQATDAQAPVSKVSAAEAPATAAPVADAVPDTEYSTETPAEEAPRAPRPVLSVPGAAVGRRKEAIARVRITPGPGTFSVNGRTLEEYFPNKLHQQLINDPFKVLDLLGSYDVIAKITGGGPSGQAGALRLAIARSLNEIDRENNRAALKKAGFLTRDARVIERKKAGLKKARKASQFSKR
jgi:small subunit ribosomal protein S9